MNDKQINQIKQNIEAATRSLNAAKKLLNGYIHNESAPMNSTNDGKPEANSEDHIEGKTIEGVFDGQNMVGPDGKLYSVPANYASKSKLVEGDTMKLTITPDGSFQYKQIGPIDRERLVGVLAQEEETDQYYVLANNHSYKILLASVTYFKGEIGNEVVILKPKTSESEWAAVENIIKNIKAEEKAKMIEGVDDEKRLTSGEEKPNFLMQQSEQVVQEVPAEEPAENNVPKEVMNSQEIEKKFEYNAAPQVTPSEEIKETEEGLVPGKMDPKEQLDNQLEEI